MNEEIWLVSEKELEGAKHHPPEEPSEEPDGPEKWWLMSPPELLPPWLRGIQTTYANGKTVGESSRWKNSPLRAFLNREFRRMMNMKEGVRAMKDSERPILQKAIDTWGEDAQTKMVLEEMSELQKELCKRWRGKFNVESIAEEVADVEIMLDQLKLMLGIEGQVDTYRESKMNRLQQRLEGQEPEPIHHYITDDVADDAINRRALFSQVRAYLHSRCDFGVATNLEVGVARDICIMIRKAPSVGQKEEDHEDR